MSYFTNHKIGNASGKYDHNPEALDLDIQSSNNVIRQFREDFLNLLNTKYYIEKETSYGRWLTEEEKIDIIVEELYKIKTEAKDNLLE